MTTPTSNPARRPKAPANSWGPVALEASSGAMSRPRLHQPAREAADHVADAGPDQGSHDDGDIGIDGRSIEPFGNGLADDEADGCQRERDDESDGLDDHRGRPDHSSSGSSTLGSARSSRLVASSSLTSRANRSSLVRISRALDSIRFSAGEMPLVCWA